MKITFKISILLTILFLVFISCKTNESKDQQNKHIQVENTLDFLPEKELEKKSLEELRLLRNEIFARKGYVFKDAELNNYFKTKNWYTPNNNTIVFSEKEQKYVDKIKKVETHLALKTNEKCLFNLSKQYSDFFPLTSEDILNEGFKYSKALYDITIHDLSPIIKGNLCGGGSVWNVLCLGNVDYQLLFYTCDSDSLYMSLAITKNEDDLEFLKLYGTYVHDFKNVDKYSFVLDQDELEITKTNYTNTEDYKEKKVSKEVKKYKLTNKGIVDL